MNQFETTYTRYLAALPITAKCACGRHLRGRCPVCSQPQQKELPIDPSSQQLALFPDIIGSLYHHERS
jgi:hypothetical protein